MSTAYEAGMGDRLAELRLRRGLTQEQLAEAAALSVDVIRKLEQGRRRTARVSSINALAAALDTEPSYLVGQPGTFEAQRPAQSDSPSVLALRRAVSPVWELLGEDDDPEGPAHNRKVDGRAPLHERDQAGRPYG